MNDLPGEVVPFGHEGTYVGRHVVIEGTSGVRKGGPQVCRMFAGNVEARDAVEKAMDVARCEKCRLPGAVSLDRRSRCSRLDDDHPRAKAREVGAGQNLAFGTLDVDDQQVRDCVRSQELLNHVVESPRRNATVSDIEARSHVTTGNVVNDRRQTCRVDIVENYGVDVLVGNRTLYEVIPRALLAVGLGVSECRLNGDPAPAEVIESLRDRISHRFVRSDVDIAPVWNMAQRSPEDDVFTILRERHKRASVLHGSSLDTPGPPGGSGQRREPAGLDSPRGTRRLARIDEPPMDPDRKPERTMPRALITGITGQDGLYLSELLLSKGYEVYGLIRGQNNPKFDLVRRTVPDVKLLTGDLTDLSSLVRALNVAQPAEVYNLGAISFVAYSWENARVTSEVTGLGVLNILEAIRLFAGTDLQSVRFYQASSSEMFGKVQEVPQRETTLLWPRSPYGVAKVFGHYMTINYRESYGMHASSGILFNHESPRRGPEFVTRKVSQAVARIALGLQDQLVLGNLDAKRDWGFAGDYVDAMWRMLQQDEADDYVVATGETHSIRELLDIAFSHVGITEWAPYVAQDPRFMRPAEVDLLIGDPSKAHEVLGWERKVDFHGLVTMMVENDLKEQRDLAGR